MERYRVSLGNVGLVVMLIVFCLVLYWVTGFAG